MIYQYQENINGPPADRHNHNNNNNHNNNHILPPYHHRNGDEESSGESESDSDMEENDNEDGLRLEPNQGLNNLNGGGVNAENVINNNGQGGNVGVAGGGGAGGAAGGVPGSVAGPSGGQAQNGAANAILPAGVAGGVENLGNVALIPNATSSPRRLASRIDHRIDFVDNDNACDPTSGLHNEMEDEDDVHMPMNNMDNLSNDQFDENSRGNGEPEGLKVNVDIPAPPAAALPENDESSRESLDVDEAAELANFKISLNDDSRRNSPQPGSSRNDIGVNYFSDVFSGAESSRVMDLNCAGDVLNGCKCSFDVCRKESGQSSADEADVHPSASASGVCTSGSVDVDASGAASTSSSSSSTSSSADEKNNCDTLQMPTDYNLGLNAGGTGPVDDVVAGPSTSAANRALLKRKSRGQFKCTSSNCVNNPEARVAAASVVSKFEYEDDESNDFDDTDDEMLGTIGNMAADLLTKCDFCKKLEADELSSDEDEEEEDIVGEHCDCLIAQLDHVNGHSSKMVVELSSRVCNKCSKTKKTKKARRGESQKEMTLNGSNPMKSGLPVNGAEKNEAEGIKFPDVAIPAPADAANQQLDEENANGVAENPVENINADEEGAQQARRGQIRNLEEMEANAGVNIPANPVDQPARPPKRLKLNNGAAANRNKTPRTIFHKALDAVNMSWDNQHLQNILASDSYNVASANSVQIAGSSKVQQTANATSVKSNFNDMGQPVWHEPLAMCAARVDSLRSHGHAEAALRLSVSVVRTMKQIQKDAQALWHKHQAYLNQQRQQQQTLEANNAEQSAAEGNCSETSGQQRHQSTQSVGGNNNESKSGNGCCCNCSGNGGSSSNSADASADSNKKRKPTEQNGSGCGSKSHSAAALPAPPPSSASSSSSGSGVLPPSTRGLNNSNAGGPSSSAALCRYGDYMSSSSRHTMPHGPSSSSSGSSSSVMNCKKCYYMRFHSGGGGGSSQYKAMWPNHHPQAGCDFDPRMRHQSSSSHTHHHHHNHGGSTMDGYGPNSGPPYPGMGLGALYYGENNNSHHHHHHGHHAAGPGSSSGMGRNPGGHYGPSSRNALGDAPSSNAIQPHVPTVAPPPPPPYPMCNSGPNSHWHSHSMINSGNAAAVCSVENCNIPTSTRGGPGPMLPSSGRYPVPVPPPEGTSRNKPPGLPPKRCNCPDNCHNEHTPMVGPVPGPSGTGPSSSARMPVPVPPPAVAGPSAPVKRRCNCVENCPADGHNDLPIVAPLPGPSRALDLPGPSSANALVPMVGPPPPPPLCTDHQKTPQCCIKSYCCKLPYGAHKMHPKMMPPPSMMAANCRACFMMETQYMNSTGAAKCDCRYHAGGGGGGGGRGYPGGHHHGYPPHHSSSMSSRHHDPMFMAASARNAVPGMPPIPGVDTHHGREELGGGLRSNGPCSHSKCAVGPTNSSAIVKQTAEPMVTKNSSGSLFNLYGQPISSSASQAGSSEPLLVDVVPNRKANCVNNCLDCTISCEVEFPLDAVACIFDCLTEACILADRGQRTEQISNINRLASFESLAGGNNNNNNNQDGRAAGNNNGNVNGNNNNNAEDAANTSIMPPQYQHIHVPNSKDKYETYLTLAFESAVLALGKQRIMPQGLYSQHVVCKQQDQLIARLQHIDLDLFLVGVLKNSTIQMMDGGPTSGFGVTIHPESVPMHTLARFLFTSLLNYYPDLAFQAGLRAMRLPVLEEPNEDRIPQNGAPAPEERGGAGGNNHHQQGQNQGAGDNENRRYGFILSRYSRWWTLGHLETQQCSLSSAMLSAAKAEPARLAGVLESARRNIHSSSHLFKVSLGID